MPPATGAGSVPAVQTDPRIDAYIATRAAFAQPILTHLRMRLHAICPQVEETIRWSMPSFSYRGRPLANMAAFKAHASFAFWDRRALATGREGEAMGQFGRLEDVSQLPPDTVFDAVLRAAMALIDAHDRPKRAPRVTRAEAEIPPTLAAALARDAAAKTVFHDQFSPSHRREYCEWIAEAKREDTRAKRVEQTLEWLREGKQRNWKYGA